MLDVLFTVDVEVWCDGWDSIDEKFPSAFKKYIYGHTNKGNYGLPYQLKIFEEFDISAVFFVEPLFAGRFGQQPLAEIVGLIKDVGQEVQLHLHPEWVDEALEPIIEDLVGKKQYLRFFTLEQQEQIIAIGSQWLKQAGGTNINAFRAGGFGFNSDTLIALKKNNINFDSSYNATHMGLDSGLMNGTILTEPIISAGVYEYPMTIYYDRRNHLRHTQLTACSFREIEGLLWQALEQERKSFVILSHNFELMNNTLTQANPIVVKRFNKLCDFLNKNRDCFNVSGFNDLKPKLADKQPSPLKSPLWKTGMRTLEQFWGSYT
ncbi:MAG: polysaccharide deacetylase [Thiohalomonadales bacterium]